MKIDNLTEQDIESVVDHLFSAGKQFCSIEAAYQQLAQTMYEAFSTDGQSDLILSRVYHSFDFSLLPGVLQQTAAQVWGNDVKEGSKFITLMGTYGEEPAWRDRTKSQGHKAILVNRDTLNKIPMVARLLQQVGFDLGVLLGEKGIGVSGVGGVFGVFYVPTALGSPYVPAQDFVAKYGVQSVLGTGVSLPQGDISIYIGFSRVNIKNEIAANVAPLMSLFWQRAFPLLEEHGMFTG